MKINELFDKPLPLKWRWKGQGTTSAFFKIDDTNFRISFFPGENEEWSLTFGSSGRHYYQAKKRDASTDYKHKAILVFSTVLNAIDTFFNEQKPAVLYFAASADRQSELYNKLAKYISSVKPEYNIRKLKSRDGEYYEITK